MINFYPGPSKIYPEVKKYFAEGIDLFSMNHRSEVFHEIFSSFKNSCKSYFKIPSDYEVSVISSATEAWEIVNQSFSQHAFHHYFNGAFGEKWANFNSFLGNQIEEHKFDLNQILDIPKAKEGIICLTHNETSNGTFINDSTLVEIKRQNPKALIALDSTSILGGDTFNFANIDICFSSVQKCLGQPPGLAVLITSPRVAAFFNQNKKYYNDLKNILANSKKLETTHTPNISAIYTLYRTLSEIEPLDLIATRIKQTNRQIIDAAKEANLNLISNNPTIASPTVLTFDLAHRSFEEVNSIAIQHNILIGKGYGEYKNTSFRIANFPAHSESDITTLLTFLKSISC